MTALERSFAALTASVAVLAAGSLAFAVVALAFRLRNDRLERRRSGLVAVWEPAMLDVLVGASPPSSVRAGVSERDRPLFLTFLLDYSRRLRGSERDTVHSLAAAHLPGVAAQARNGSAEERGRAVEMLASMGMPEYADVVAEALDDPSPIVAMIAARGLFRRGLEAYFPAVLERLHRFTGWSRSFLASMLAGGGPETAPLLRGMLADPRESALVRAVTADALRLLNDLPAMEIAADLLHVESDRELVVGCLRLIRQLGHRDHVAIVRPLTSSSDPVVRATAAGAIGAIGGPAEIELLRTLLDRDDDYWVTLESARGLRSLGDIGHLETLAGSGGKLATLARQVITE